MRGKEQPREIRLFDVEVDESGLRVLRGYVAILAHHCNHIGD